VLDLHRGAARGVGVQGARHPPLPVRPAAGPRPLSLQPRRLLAAQPQLPAEGAARPQFPFVRAHPGQTGRSIPDAGRRGRRHAKQALVHERGRPRRLPPPIHRPQGSQQTEAGRQVRHGRLSAIDISYSVCRCLSNLAKFL